jgi:hypothetical protein
MCYTVYRIIVCTRTKIRMISSLRSFSVRILDTDRFTIVVFQILYIKYNYLPGIVHVPRCRRPSECRLPASLLEESFWWRGSFSNPVRPELLGLLGEESLPLRPRRWYTYDREKQNTEL